MKALALLLACSLWGTSVLAQDQAADQIARVKAEFAGKSFAEINATLASMRPLAFSESDKKMLMRDLPLITDSNRVADRRQLDRLAARLQATLKLYDRAGVIELVVFRDPRPIIYNKPGVVVVLSTEMLKMVGDNDAALVGVVAHELAHEYVAMSMLHALQATDLVKIRQLELFCDAVAVITLLNLQLDPASYSQALTRICAHSKAAASLNDGTGSHPALATRLKLIAEIRALMQSVLSPRE